MSDLPTPSHDVDEVSPSALLISAHGLDKITAQDTVTHGLLQDSSEKIHRLILESLEGLKKEDLDLDTATKIAQRITRNLKLHYEMLDMKGKIHDKDERRGKIIARVGIRQTEHGQEAIAEVEVNGRHSA